MFEESHSSVQMHTPFIHLTIDKSTGRARIRQHRNGAADLSLICQPFAHLVKPSASSVPVATATGSTLKRTLWYGHNENQQPYICIRLFQVKHALPLAIVWTAEWILDSKRQGCQLRLSAWNPNRAIHANNHWDLGDPHSAMLDDFSVTFYRDHSQLAQTDALAQADQAPSGVLLSVTAWDQERNYQAKYQQQNISHASLSQFTSGGCNAMSKNHIDDSGRIPFSEQPASMTVDGVSQELVRINPALLYQASASSVSASPEPASQAPRQSDWPTINSEQKDCGLLIACSEFWQRFPAAFEYSVNTADDKPQASTWSFVDPAYPCELQGGETKAHTLEVTSVGQPLPEQLHTRPDEPAQRSELRLSPAVDSRVRDTPYQRLIEQGLVGERNFFAKREQLDEYGWRHFGDVYADHEANLDPDAEYWVSHYNNQYDLLSGFIKQHQFTGEPQWKLLADQLFEHMIYIDMYRTEVDRTEYNGGLFWHTDHYVEAETATHRTYSKRQQHNVYEGHTGGGGPSSSHCYTSGLLHYYEWTKDERAKQALLSMYYWVSSYVEGEPTLFSLLTRLKNNGECRHPFKGCYQPDRKFGNYLNTVIDYYLLSGRPSVLDDAERIILSTLTPDTDIGSLGLDNIEETWFYTVFLQSMIKYLEHAAPERTNYHAIGNTLLGFADWMATHEDYTLNTPEKLEFPNHTWAAQDIRKVHILRFAQRLIADDRERTQRYELKANDIERHILSELQRSDETQHTRVLALLMQNGDLQYRNHPIQPINTQQRHYHIVKRGIGYELKRLFSQYSLHRELRQLCQRMPALDNRLNGLASRSWTAPW